MSNGIPLPDVNGLFDTIYVAGTLKELRYRGIKRGLRIASQKRNLSGKQIHHAP